MNKDKLIYISVAVVLLLILLTFSLPNYVELLLIAVFLFVSSYLLLIKKKSSLLSIPISTPTSEVGKNVTLLAGILALIAGIITSILSLFTWIT